MADDIARLGYEIDSSQARTAAGDLDKMSMAATKAAASADKIKISNNGISTTYKNAAMSAKQLAQTNILLQQHFAKTGNSAQMMGVKVGAANRHILNMGFQFQDIGMMLASGQNPLILAMQQGTQVAGIFNQMRMEGQSAFSALRGGLIGLINPTSLLTIGTIAAGAALVQWAVAALGATEDADEFSKKLEEVRENSKALNEELRQMRFGVSSDELVLMDAIAKQREKVLEAEERIATARGQGKRGAADNLKAQQDELNALMGQLDALRKSASEKERMISATKELADAERMIGEQMLINVQATRENEQVTQLLRAGVSATVIDAMRLAGVDMASPISAAAERAGVLATNLGIALSAAMAIENWQASADISAEDQAMSVPIDNRRAAASGRSARYQFDLSESRRGGRGGRGGGGREDARARELEAFIASLQTERETLEAWRIEQLELLAQYNDAELAALGGKNEAKLRLEQEYQEKISAIRQQERSQTLGFYGTLFGNMATLFEAGGKKTFGIAKAFSIAQGLINSYRAYTEVLADPSLIGKPLLRQALAASTLAAGLGQVASIRNTNFNGGGSSSGTSAPSSASGTTATPAQPERVVRVAFDGPEWVQGIIEPLMTQIYEQTGDGTRIVFAK